MATSREKRHARRTKTFLPTSVVVGADCVRAHVLDVSAAGSRMHIGKAAALNSEVRVQLNGRELLADVVWARAGLVGLQFRVTLEPEQLVQLTPAPVAPPEGSSGAGRRR